MPNRNILSLIVLMAAAAFSMGCAAQPTSTNEAKEPFDCKTEYARLSAESERLAKIRTGAGASPTRVMIVADGNLQQRRKDSQRDYDVFVGDYDTFKKKCL